MVANWNLNNIAVAPKITAIGQQDQLAEKTKFLRFENSS